jgi:restriction system protein
MGWWQRKEESKMCTRCGQRRQLGKYRPPRDAFIHGIDEYTTLCDHCYTEDWCQQRRDRNTQSRLKRWRQYKERSAQYENLCCARCGRVAGPYIPVAERDAMTFDPAFAYGPRYCLNCKTIVNRFYTQTEREMLAHPPGPPFDPPIEYDLIRAWVNAQVDALERAEAEWQRTEPERQQRRTMRSEWLALAPAEFEHACANVLRQVGYTSVRVTRATGDGGIDLVAMKEGNRYAGQCKRYKGTVDIAAIRDLAGVIALSKGTYAGGIFLTTGTFSPSTRTLAERANITLIDGPQLVGLAQLPERIEEETASDPTDALFASDPTGEDPLIGMLPDDPSFSHDDHGCGA